MDLAGDQVGGNKGDIYLTTKNPLDLDFVRIGKVPMSFHSSLQMGCDECRCSLQKTCLDWR